MTSDQARVAFLEQAIDELLIQSRRAVVGLTDDSAINVDRERGLIHASLVLEEQWEPVPRPLAVREQIYKYAMELQQLKYGTPNRDQ